MSIINTGNLQLSKLTVNVSEDIHGAFNCDVPNFALDNGRTTLSAASQMSCSASLDMTTALIEAGNFTTYVDVLATSVLGAEISSSKEVVITPRQLPELSVTVLACEIPSTTSGRVQAAAISVWITQL
jgi:hypothetical protein